MPKLEPKQADPSEKPSTIEDWLQAPQFRENLAKILPRHLTSERFAAIAMRQFRLVPGLRKCAPDSILSGFMDAAALGLEIGLNGEAYLIPYNQKVKDADGNWHKVHLAQLQIGYLGHLKLAWQSQMIERVEAEVVTYDEVEDGRFDYQHGTSGFLNHKPSEGRDLREENIAYAYACVWPKGAKDPIFRVLDKKQIERLRNTGQSANSPAWKNHYDEMAIAKALKRTLKWAPKSREVSVAVALDDQADAGIAQTFNSAEDVAGILPAQTARNAGQEMMDNVREREESGQQGGQPPSAAEDRGRESSGPSQQEREPEPVAAQKQKPANQATPADQSDLGW